MLQDLACERGQTGESRFSIISSKKWTRRAGSFWREEGTGAGVNKDGGRRVRGIEALHEEDPKGRGEPGVQGEGKREREGVTPEWAEVPRLCAPPQAMRLESERLSPSARRLPTPGRIHAPPPQDGRDGLASSGLAQSVLGTPYRLLCRLDMVLTSGFPLLPPTPPRPPPPPPPSRDAGRSAKASDRKRSHPRECSVPPRPAHVPPLPLLPVARRGGRDTRVSRPRPHPHFSPPGGS